MSETNNTSASNKDFELSDEMLEAVSGGAINVLQELYLDNFISASKQRGETLDELVDYLREFNRRKNRDDLKGGWAWIDGATPEEMNDIVGYLKQNW